MARLSKADLDQGKVVFQLVRATSFLRVQEAIGRVQTRKIRGFEASDELVPGGDAADTLKDLKNAIAKNQETHPRQHWLNSAGKFGFLEKADGRSGGAQLGWSSRPAL